MSCARSCVGGVDVFMMGYLAICFVVVLQFRFDA